MGGCQMGPARRARTREFFLPPFSPASPDGSIRGAMPQSKKISVDWGLSTGHAVFFARLRS